MKSLSIMAFSLLPLTGMAQNSDSIKALEERVQKLEYRVRMLERQVAAQKAETPEAKKMAQVAKEYMDKEKEKYKAEDIAAAEAIYRPASWRLDDEASKVVLDSVVAIYPHLNRAGCAQLYRAQQEKGEQKERLLKDCLDRFKDCYYGDGAQVGALATLQLGIYYKKAGLEKESQKLLRQIEKKYPGAVGHDGILLADKINE